MSSAFQVAVGVLAWEYDRNAKKDDVKRAKEEAYRLRVDERFAECQKVTGALG